jgi:hypothetical protein
MATAHMKWAAVMRLLRKGLVTQDEAADLAGTSVYVIKEWAQRERIDIATTRARASQRGSIRMLRPSAHPKSRSPCVKAARNRWASGSASANCTSTPTRRIRSPCCARAVTDHAAAPPSSVMKSRRFTA